MLKYMRVLHYLVHVCTRL